MLQRPVHYRVTMAREVHNGGRGGQGGLIARSGKLLKTSYILFEFAGLFLVVILGFL